MQPARSWLLFAENELQIAALLFMAVVYALKIRWILKFPAGADRQPPNPDPRTDASRGASVSLAQIALPWTMESTRAHPWLYAQFVVFHLGVALSIAMSFVIPYAPGLMAYRGVAAMFQVVFAVAVMAGVARFVRRLADARMRLISSPDDYFSMALLVCWLALSFLAAGGNALMAYFVLTAFFLIYVPFSKISHYIYYPFARWYLGKTLGYRGVYPLRRKHEMFT